MRHLVLEPIVTFVYGLCRSYNGPLAATLYLPIVDKGFTSTTSVEARLKAVEDELESLHEWSVKFQRGHQGRL
jgi:hypothetical protein